MTVLPSWGVELQELCSQEAECSLLWHCLLGEWWLLVADQYQREQGPVCRRGQRRVARCAATPLIGQQLHPCHCCAPTTQCFAAEAHWDVPTHNE